MTPEESLTRAAADLDSQNAANQPSYECAAYREMAEPWEIVGTVAGGTRAVQAEGEKYLPRETGETKENYDRRLRRSVLFNWGDQGEL
jgi:hypothetical protein